MDVLMAEATGPPLEARATPESPNACEACGQQTLDRVCEWCASGDLDDGQRMAIAHHREAMREARLDDMRH